MACRDCASGSLHEGTPLGRVETVHGLQTYIAEPPEGIAPKGVIVMIADIFGWELPNSRILADVYAKKGSYKVYLPDFMNGHWLSHSTLSSMEALLEKGGSWWSIPKKIFFGIQVVSLMGPCLFLNRQSVSKPRIVNFFRALRGDEGASLPIGTAGFCWGGLYVALLCADNEKSSNGKSLIDAGFTAHPSQLTVPQDIEALKLPLSISVGDADMALSITGVKQIQEIFEKKKDEKFEIVVVPGAKHGFAVRGNQMNEKEVQQGIEAEDQAIRFWAKYLQ